MDEGNPAPIARPVRLLVRPDRDLSQTAAVRIRHIQAVLRPSDVGWFRPTSTSFPWGCEAPAGCATNTAVSLRGSEAPGYPPAQEQAAADQHEK